MSIEEIIDNLELYTVGRPKKDRLFMTVEELQNLIDKIKLSEQESIIDKLDKIQTEIDQVQNEIIVDDKDLDEGKRIAFMFVHQIIDKYKTKSRKFNEKKRS